MTDYQLYTSTAPCSLARVDQLKAVLKHCKHRSVWLTADVSVCVKYQLNTDHLTWQLRYPAFTLPFAKFTAASDVSQHLQSKSCKLNFYFLRLELSKVRWGKIF